MSQNSLCMHEYYTNYTFYSYVCMRKYKHHIQYNKYSYFEHHRYNRRYQLRRYVQLGILSCEVDTKPQSVLQTCLLRSTMPDCMKSIGGNLSVSMVSFVFRLRCKDSPPLAKLIFISGNNSANSHLSSFSSLLATKAVTAQPRRNRMTTTYLQVHG